MRKFIASGVCGTIVAFGLSSQAAIIGHWDAAAPGANSSTTWQDHSASGYDMGAAGSAGAPVWNAGGWYDLDRGNGFVGTGDNSVFNFETEVAGAGLGTPFSIHIYQHRTSFPGGGTTGENWVGKGPQETENAGQWNGWLWGGNGDNAQRVDMSMQVGNNSDRMYHRIQDDDGHPAGFSDLDVMQTMTHDGSGTLAGTKQYINGLPEGITWTLDTLTANMPGSSTQNEYPLYFGWDGRGVESGTDANVYFIEIHNTVLSDQDVLDRWNDGSPSRVPEPGMMALLALGGGLLWWRRSR